MASPVPDLLDGERHHEALEALAIQSLADGDLGAAIRYADRRCRMLPLAKASHYILRGDISYRLNFTDAALRDIETALELAPDDLAANRRMMRWGDSASKLRSARRLLAREHDFSGLREAIEIVEQTGQRIFCALDHIGSSILGWVAWRGAASITLRDSERTIIAKIANDPDHPLVRADMRAASISIEIPRSVERSDLDISSVSLWHGRRSVFHLPINKRDRPAARADENSEKSILRNKRSKTTAKQNNRASRVTLVIPVYDDFSATKKCIESVLAEVAFDERVSVLIVDDVTPDNNIRILLDKTAQNPRVGLLTNDRNLGFVGSVNRALATIEIGDIVLLNSDTIVPAGFVKKLSQAAYADSDIGTVTPFSNNGEFTSFPIPFKANPIPSVENITLLDQIAAKANPGVIVDIPNGIGFCLYITRRCLDAVGSLSDHYHRGYLEDVDLCLRAANRGFRNVAAAFVFVGHQGSASFGTEKRSLVVFNLERLEARFPNYRAECAAFLKMDPLAPRRSAIELLLHPTNRGATLVVTGSGVMHAVVCSRADDLVAEGTPTLIAMCRRRATSVVLSLADAAGKIPQSLCFDLADDREIHALETYLISASLSRIEIADPAATPREFLEVLLKTGVPFDLLIADEGLLELRRGVERDDESNLNARLWDRVAAEAKTIFIPNSRARAFAETLFEQAALPSSPNLVSKIVCAKHFQRTIRTIEHPTSANTLGIAVVGESVFDYELVTQISRLFRQQLPDISIVVIGRTIDDLTLMKLENVFVTGQIAASELDQVMDWYQPLALFLARRTPLFGHPLVEAIFQQERFPLAVIDRPFEGRQAIDRFLIHPSLSAAAIAKELVGWFNQFGRNNP